jgi:uncharacterized membrane protein
LFIVNTFLFKENYDELNKNNVYLILIAISSLLELFFCYFFHKKRNLKIETIFLVLAIVLGALYICALPIGSAPDESAHFKRAYEISTGHLLSDKNSDGIGGRLLPDSINTTFSLNIYNSKYRDVISLINSTKNNSDFSFQAFANTSLYSPICYIPQVIGILIGRILNLPMVLIAYLSRISNYICWIIIMYFSIKYIPCNKKSFLLIAFLPMSFQSAISCQADCLTNAVAFALTRFNSSYVVSKN